MLDVDKQKCCHSNSKKVQFMKFFLNLHIFNFHCILFISRHFQIHCNQKNTSCITKMKIKIETISHKIRKITEKSV